ncbi:hypothetical protein V8C37DRAFT_416185, partial [Trichoderma ceciliae]
IQTLDSESWNWSWNTTTCGCSVPRVLRRQRCRYRSCGKCVGNALHSTFTAMQQWAESAEKYPEWWTEREGDHLLFRRTKMRLRNEYERSHSENGKQQAGGLQQNWLSQYGTIGNLSSLTVAVDALPGPSSLENSTKDYLSKPNSTLYPISEAICGEMWNDDMGARSSTVHLETPGIIDFNLEASTAAESTMLPCLDHQQNTLPQIIYEPPQPDLAFQQHWAEGGHAAQLAQPQPELLPQAANTNLAVIDFDDLF